MTEWNYSNDNKEVLLIKNGEKSYEISPFLSVSDIQLVNNKLQGNQDLDYELIVAEVIANHTSKTFSPSEISELDDAFFEEYIDICVSDDSMLKENYEPLQIPDKYKRFVLAIDGTEKQLAKELSESIKQSLDTGLGEVVESIRKDFAQAIVPAVRVSESLAAIASTCQEIWQSTWIENLKTIAKTARSAIQYSKVFFEISSALQEFINNIHIPSITEEDKQNLIRSYTTWGKLGWTPPPNAELRVFNIEPEDAIDAYQRLRGYFSDSAMDTLFNKTKQLKHIKKTDFDEAVNCFRSGNNKACVLILFSMIDSRLIRSQLDEDRNGKGLRSSGKSAAKKLFHRLKSKHFTESMLFTVLDQVNILTALETVFDDGNDFKVQPKVINRNFVDHGMLYRKVTRKDCIMLFLLLYNFTRHLNSFVGKNEI